MQDKSYEHYLKQVTAGVTSAVTELSKYNEGNKFKYEELKGQGNCPTGVDPTKKEVSVRNGNCLTDCCYISLQFHSSNLSSFMLQAIPVHGRSLVVYILWLW